ncbi:MULTISPECIES: hypothetical protein [unclassified Chitinophaga]|uniref:hypothetical protein n=1 Tax=unclassified Chitinophaga TaxID=2619133 RepID=UPI00300FACE5
MKTKLSVLCLLFLIYGCSKSEYTQIKEPAYLRVFNNLNYILSMSEKDNKVPFLCMIINPTLDATGMPVGGEVVENFLDQRDSYSPPYPSQIGNSTSVNNPEYPGKRDVLAGPVLNGFDLSSWAQVPSGRLRIMFLYRPRNEVPFFQLDDKLKRDVLLDTTIELTAREVYTLHILQKDFNAKRVGMVLRQENFYKLPLSDSLVYVNFYNYSAKGFWQADNSLKPSGAELRSFRSGIKDNMNIYLTLFKNQQEPATAPFLSNYRGKFLGALQRDSGSNIVSPYYSFPLWADVAADGIRTDIWERFEFLLPGLDIADNPYNSSGNGTFQTYGNFAAINCLVNGSPANMGVSFKNNGMNLPNLLVNIHSGVYNPRTFATVSTIEVVNSRVYLTTVQRKYPAPVY